MSLKAAAADRQFTAEERASEEIRRLHDGIDYKRRQAARLGKEIRSDTEQLAKRIADTMPLNSPKERLFSLIYSESKGATRPDEMGYVSMNELRGAYGGSNGNRRLFDAAPDILARLKRDRLLFLLEDASNGDVLVKPLPVAPMVMEIISKNRERNSSTGLAAMARRDDVAEAHGTKPVNIILAEGSQCQK